MNDFEGRKAIAEEVQRQREMQRQRLEDAASILLLNELLDTVGYCGPRDDQLKQLASDAARWRQWQDNEVGIRDVYNERIRQILSEGFTAEKDDAYKRHQLADAAACYAWFKPGRQIMRMWPWAMRWFKPNDSRSNYVKAAALLIAEIDRLDRLTAK